MTESLITVLPRVLDSLVTPAGATEAGVAGVVLAMMISFGF
jgi:hypothetical protein